MICMRISVSKTWYFCGKCIKFLPWLLILCNIDKERGGLLHRDSWQSVCLYHSYTGSQRRMDLRGEHIYSRSKHWGFVFHHGAVHFVKEKSKFGEIDHKVSDYNISFARFCRGEGGNFADMDVRQGHALFNMMISTFKGRNLIWLICFHTSFLQSCADSENPFLKEAIKDLDPNPINVGAT